MASDPLGKIGKPHFGGSVWSSGIKLPSLQKGPSGPVVTGAQFPMRDLISDEKKAKLQYWQLAEIYRGTWEKKGIYEKTAMSDAIDIRVRLSLFCFGIKLDGLKKFDIEPLFHAVQTLFYNNKEIYDYENREELGKFMELFADTAIRAAGEGISQEKIFHDFIVKLCVEVPEFLVTASRIDMLKAMIDLAIVSAKKDHNLEGLAWQGFGPLFKDLPYLLNDKEAMKLVIELCHEAIEKDVPASDVLHYVLSPLLRAGGTKDNHKFDRPDQLKTIARSLISWMAELRDVEYRSDWLREIGLTDLLNSSSSNEAKQKAVICLERLTKEAIRKGLKCNEIASILGNVIMFVGDDILIATKYGGVIKLCNKIMDAMVRAKAEGYRINSLGLNGIERTMIEFITDEIICDLILEVCIAEAKKGFDDRTFFTNFLYDSLDRVRYQSYDVESMRKSINELIGADTNISHDAEMNEILRELFWLGMGSIIRENPGLLIYKERAKFLKEFSLAMQELNAEIAASRIDQQNARSLGSFWFDMFIHEDALLALEEGPGPIKLLGKMLIRLAAKASRNSFDISNIADSLSLLLKKFPKMSDINEQKKLESLLDHLLNIFMRATKHNLDKIKYIMGNINMFNPVQLERYLSLAEKIANTAPRLCCPVLEGIFKAVENGTLPKDLDAKTEEKILIFISRMHTFDPMLFSHYEIEGEAFLEKIMKISMRVNSDEIGEDDIHEIRSMFPNQKDNAAVLAIIQARVPLSGASFVGRDQQTGLFDTMAACGDLRKHVPQYWRGKEIVKEMNLASISVKEGEVIDPEGKVKEIIELLRSEGKLDRNDAIAELKKYLAGDKDDAKARQDVLCALLRYAGSRDLLGEKVDRLGDKDHYTLKLLEEIFKDKDNLTTLLADLLGEIEKDSPQLVVVQVPTKKVSHPQILAMLLRKNLQKIATKEGRVSAAARILAGVSISDITENIIPLLSDAPETVEAVKAGLESGNSRTLSKKFIIDNILSGPLKLITDELAKFEVIEEKAAIKLGFRVVKGIPFGIWGLNAGVCIATDVKLWKDPAFKLIAIEDKNTGIIGGFIHVFETEIDGQKALIVPGIEPSVEFLDGVDPKQLYDQIESALKEFAKMGGYKAVYIPEQDLVMSNRTAIQQAIHKKKYNRKPLNKPVQWNNVPQPYPINAVLVVEVE